MQDHIDLSGYADLHDRLDHLVTYSSQLIFVSGEGLSVNQDFVEAYLAKKSDIANIVYLGAANKLTVSQYRQRVVEQLVGKIRLDYTRPLTETLPRVLGKDEQFILIAVTNAEQLPSTMLSELWDLVLQNRFARQRHHMNILLFGEHHWAEQAKAELPTNHSDKPVLLSHQHFPAQREHQEMSELEQLIREKREQFALRVQRRSHQHEEPALLSLWWSKLLIGLVFLGVFGGLLQWLYGEQIRELWQDVDSMYFSPPMQPVKTTPDASLSPPAVTDDKPVSVDSSDDQQVAKASKADKPMMGWSDAIKQVNNTPAKPVESNKTEPSVSQSAFTSLPAPAEAKAQEETPSNLQNGTQAPGKVSPSEDNRLSDDPASPEPGHQEDEGVNTTLTPDAKAARDYPVKDIVSVSQLPKPQYAMDGDRIMASADKGYMLQLSGMSSRSVLKDFINDNKLTGKVWVYVTQRDNAAWYVVVKNQFYSSIEQAQQAVSQLSPALRAEQPFAKGITEIKQEIRRHTE